MKIIQIVGWSKSGKTTFIKNLIPELEKKGRVATIKHLGDHDFNLEKGKDTTDFYESGSTISIGIDASKSVAAIRTNSLDEILRMLSNFGINYTILEGFKTQMFSKIAIGDITVDNCVLSNPTVNDVISSLHLFEEYRPTNPKKGKSTKGRR